MKRYSRQTVMPEIGIEGQKALLASKVLIVGVGGLGSPAALYLAAAGVGTLGLIDPDRVDVTNLQRQILYSTELLTELHSGEQTSFKVDAAKKRLLQLNPDIKIETYQEALGPSNAEDIVSAYDLILDGTDKFYTKYLINDLCARLNKIFIYGSVTGFHGMFAAFRPHQGPCLRCYQKTPPQNYIPNCQEAGVLGPAVGVIGSMQAALAIKALLFRFLSKPNLNPHYGKIFAFDIGAMEFFRAPTAQRANCLACVQHKVELVPQSEVQACKAATVAPTDFILDVREPHEFQAGSLPGAINWPLSRLRLDPNEVILPVDRNILVCCQSGIRSQSAIQILQAIQTRNYLNVEGGINKF